MRTNHVVVGRDGAVLTIAMNRPEKKNALTHAMYDAMADALAAAAGHASIRVILITGTGDAFTAGNDLGDFLNTPPADGFSPVQRFLSALSTAEKPVVAAVNGLAIGIGTTMLLHCDLVFLADTARLMTPFVNLALVPEAASSWLLPARIGHVRAYAMFALGEPLDATTALACGLANAVVPVSDLRARARAAAEALTKRPAGSLSQTKALMREMDKIAAQISRESVLFRERLRTGEAREAFAAFAERRKPDFSKAG
jgi:enoyl-CoA hydratase/carnithine racemase